MADDLRHPNWELAEQILHRVLPGSTGFDPECIAGLSSKDWQDFEIDDREPFALLEDLLSYCDGRIAGTLILVTMGSYLTSAGPFFVQADRLREFVDKYSGYVDDSLISGDVIILSARTGIAIIVHHHHSGKIATVFGEAADCKN